MKVNVSIQDQDYPLVADDVRANAQAIVVGYGARALEQARRLEAASDVPRYAAAVLAEVERLCRADSEPK